MQSIGGKDSYVTFTQKNQIIPLDEVSEAFLTDRQIPPRFSEVLPLPRFLRISYRLGKNNLLIRSKLHQTGQSWLVHTYTYNSP